MDKDTAPMNPTLPPSRASRRLFLQHSSAMGMLAGAGAPMALNLLAAGNVAAQTATDYRALVCVFLFGGNDSYNMILPTDSASWAAYSTTRNQAPDSIALLAPGVFADAGAAVGDYPRQGFLPAAVVNFIALLGWNPKTEREIFTLAELAEIFSLENVNRAPGRFDLEKCKWVNQQHLLGVSVEDFAAAARPFVEEAGLPIPENYQGVIAAVKDKVRLFGDVPGAVDFLLKDHFEYDDEALVKVRGNAAAAGLLAPLAAAFEALPDWSAEAAKAAVTETAVAAGTKPGQLMFPLRAALTGRAHGPDLGAVLDLLGRERCVRRLRDFSKLI